MGSEAFAPPDVILIYSIFGKVFSPNQVLFLIYKMDIVLLLNRCLASV